MYAYESGVFSENCRALADAARACGAQLRKLPEHAVSVEMRGESVAFPIASDDRDWALTTPEEAFYAAMLDAEAFTALTVDTDSALGRGDDTGAPSAAKVEHESAAHRVAALAALFGGNAVLDRVLQAGGLRDTGSRFSR